MKLLVLLLALNASAGLSDLFKGGERKDNLRKCRETVRRRIEEARRGWGFFGFTCERGIVVSVFAPAESNIALRPGEFAIKHPALFGLTTPPSFKRAALGGPQLYRSVMIWNAGLALHRYSDKSGVASVRIDARLIETSSWNRSVVPTITKEEAIQRAKEEWALREIKASSLIGQLFVRDDDSCGPAVPGLEWKVSGFRGLPEPEQLSFNAHTGRPARRRRNRRSSRGSSMADWARSFFRPAIFSPDDRFALASAPVEAAFAWKKLGLSKGSSVLDVCCGTGRHSLAFARRGARVVGLDLTASYIAKAKRRGGGKNPRFMLGDMSQLHFNSEFDAAVNLWTSFGYGTLGEDRRTLKGIARALKPGGRFLIDFLSIDWIRRNFKPRSWDLRSDGSYLLREDRLIEGADPRLEARWLVLRRGKSVAEGRTVVRAYDLAWLSRELRRAGLEPQRSWGDFSGARYSAHSKRLLVLSRKS